MSVNRNILKELEEIVPGFKWPENQADFDVPEGYFEQLEMRVRDVINDREENVLPVASKEHPIYHVPEGYFESLPGKLLSKVTAESKETPVVILPRRHRKWQAWASAAAIAALVALSGLLWLPKNHTQFQQQTSSSINQQLASLSDQAIEQYLGTQINSSNLNEVYDNLNDQDLQNTLTNGLSTDAIEEYLQNNTTDSLSF